MIKNKYLKTVFIVAGSFFVVLGVIGIILPLIPTTPFFLLAIACFGRSSKKLYDLLHNNNLFGKHLKSYQTGRGISWKIKLFTLFFLWLSVGLSVRTLENKLLVKGILIIIALGVTVHMITIKTLTD